MGENMSLVTSTDCHQSVSSQAFECPACGRPLRDRSYLTPLGQTVVGGIALIACFAWPPLFYILSMIVFGRHLARARRGSIRSFIVAAGALIAICAASMYVLSSYALVVLVPALAALVWLASPRVGAKNALVQDTAI